MAKKSYLNTSANYQKAKPFMKGVRAGRDEAGFDPEGQTRRIYSELREIPSIDNLIGRYQSPNNDAFDGTVFEFRDAVDARRKANAEKMDDPSFRAMLKRKAIRNRKEKGYDTNEIRLRMDDGATIEADEMEALQHDETISALKSQEMKIAKQIAALKAELEEYQTMQTSFDKNTRRAYSGLKASNMADDIKVIEDMLKDVQGQTKTAITARDYFMDTRPKKEKGSSAERYNKPGKPKPVTTDKPKAELIKAKKE